MVDIIEVSAEDDVPVSAESEMIFNSLKELHLRHGVRTGIINGDEIYGGIIDIIDESTVYVKSAYTIKPTYPYLEQAEDNEFYAFDGQVFRLRSTEVTPHTEWVLTTPTKTVRTRDSNYVLEQDDELSGRVQVVPWLNKTVNIIALETGLEFDCGTVTKITETEITINKQSYTYEKLLSEIKYGRMIPPYSFNQPDHGDML
jgi:hypothetical protein